MVFYEWNVCAYMLPHRLTQQAFHSTYRFSVASLIPLECGFFGRGWGGGGRAEITYLSEEA